MEEMTPARFAGIVIALILVGLGAWFFFNPGIFGKVWVIVYHNWGFWILLSTGTLYAAFRKYRNSEDFTWAEFPIQLLTDVVSLIFLCTIFFYFGSDLHDIEDWNGKTMQVVYQEEYDIRTCSTSCDKDGHCTTTCTCTPYPPSWTLFTNNERRGTESTGISPSNYGNFVRWFANEHIAGSQGDMCAGHPGLTHVTVFPGDPDKLVPTAIEHPFVNYLKASESIRKTTGGNTEGFEGFLVPYPRVHGGFFGEIYLDRVIIAGDVATGDHKADLERWSVGVDSILDRALADLGKRKEVNILVYIVGTSDRKFYYALDEYWTHAKKNDVVVIVGTTEFPRVDWAGVIAWSETEDFAVHLKNRVQDMGNINDGAAFARTILAQIDLPLESGGFQRMPMDELVYLADDVKIAWWAMLLVIILNGGICWLCSWALLNNDVRAFVARSYDRASDGFGTAYDGLRRGASTVHRNTIGRMRMPDWRRRNDED